MAKGPGYGSEYRAKYPDKAKKSYEETAREYGTRPSSPVPSPQTTTPSGTNITLDPKLGYDKGRVLSDVKGVLDTSPKGTRASVRQYRETDASGQLMDVTEVSATTPGRRLTPSLNAARANYAETLRGSQLLSLIPKRERQEEPAYNRTQIIARPGQSKSGSPLEPFYQKIDPFYRKYVDTPVRKGVIRAIESPRTPQSVKLGLIPFLIESEASPTETFLTTGIAMGTPLLQTSTTAISTVNVKPRVTRQIGELSVRETGTKQLTASRTIQGVKYTKTIEGKGFETVGRASVKYKMPTGKEFTREFSLGGKGVVADTGRTGTLSRTSRGITLSKEGDAFVFKGRMSADLISKKGLGTSISNKVVGKGISFDKISTTESLSGGRLVRGRSLGVTKEIAPKVYEFRGLGRVSGQASPFAQRFKLSSAIAPEGYSVIKGTGQGMTVGRSSTSLPLSDSALKISLKQLTSVSGQMASEALGKISIPTFKESLRVSGLIGGKGAVSAITLTQTRQRLATRTRLDQEPRLDVAVETIQISKTMQRSQQVSATAPGQAFRTGQTSRQATSLITIPSITPGFASRGRAFGRPITPGRFGSSTYFAQPVINLNMEMSDIFGGFRGARKYSRYTPSFGAIIFNIRGKKPKRRETGINLRPITKGFKFQGRFKI